MRMDIGYIVGWIGVGLGLCVPIPQLINILTHKRIDGVSLMTYVFLVGCLVCYLGHAIYISAEVFIFAQAFNLCSNGTILVLLIRNKGKRKKRSKRGAVD